MNFPCSLYEGANWCTPDGTKGPGWVSFWGGFNGFAADGMSAKTACCGYGGGVMDNSTWSEELPSYTPVEDYPHENADYHFTKADSEQ